MRLYTAAGEHHGLIELYDRATEQAKSQAIAIAYLFKMGSLFEDVLHEVGSAVEVYKRILSLQPDHLGAIHAMQRATERALMHRELVQALDMEANLTQDRTRLTGLQHRAAEIVADALDDPESALPRFEHIRKRDPKHVPTLQSLSRVYRRLDRFSNLMGTYEKQLEVTHDATAKVALLVNMGRAGRDQARR